MVDPSKRRVCKNELGVIYPNFLSFIAPVLHCSEIHVSTPLKREKQCLQKKNISDDNSGPKLKDATEEQNLYYPSQEDNDRIKNFGLAKSNGELLTSRVKE